MNPKDILKTRFSKTAVVYLSLVSLWWTLFFVITPARADQAFKRPPLQTHQGNYFRWSAPDGWRHSESTNGVTLTAPDGQTKVMYAVLMRSRGSNDSKSFLLSIMKKIPGVGRVQAGRTRNLPNQKSAIPGTFWRVIETDLTYTDTGVAVSGTFTCGINAYYGMYDAMIIGFQAPKSKWPQAKQFLPGHEISP